MTKHKFKYDWKLADAKFKENKGTVFSCFACGGGSTMGYKKAGYKVLGYNEIDKRMAELYNANHKPKKKFRFVEPIQTFKLRKDLPKELYNLTILDGSPPCSTFSLAGLRDKAWGKNKKFKEGQAEQVLDTLFFDFIDLAEELQPKVVLSENVKGITMTKAIKYITEIYKAFDKAGYYTNHWILNGADMGLPQARERVFFVSVRKDIAGPFVKKQGFFNTRVQLNMNFKEPWIPIKEFATFVPKTEKQNYLKHRFGDRIVKMKEPLGTITTIDRYWKDKETLLSDETLIKASSFPTDYDFLKFSPQYVVGMSVPPVMMAQVAHRVHKQILSKIK